MGVRSFVSFEADFPRDGEPPGEELARFVSDALRAAGVTHDAPHEREGWAWDIHSDRVDCIIGLVDDGPREWLITNHGELPLLRRVSRTAREEQEEALRRWCEAIDAALKADGRFRTIRWYDAAAFDRDHGDTWGDEP